MSFSWTRGYFSSRFLNFILTLLSLPVTGVLRALPRKHRFGAARLFARAGEPFYRRLIYPLRRPPILDGPREDFLRVTLRLMDRSGIAFDPTLQIHGWDLVHPGAAIFLTGHFMLTALWTRWVLESGERISLISVDPQYRLMGTTRSIEIISGHAMLVAARSRLLAGGKVNCAADFAVEREDWIRVETEAGSRWISDAMPRLAERLSVPLFFVAARVDEDWNVVVHVEKPSSNDARTTTDEFCRFFLSQSALIRR